MLLARGHPPRDRRQNADRKLLGVLEASGIDSQSVLSERHLRIAAHFVRGVLRTKLENGCPAVRLERVSGKENIPGLGSQRGGVPGTVQGRSLRSQHQSDRLFELVRVEVRGQQPRPEQAECGSN